MLTVKQSLDYMQELRISNSEWNNYPGNWEWEAMALLVAPSLRSVPSVTPVGSRRGLLPHCLPPGGHRTRRTDSAIQDKNIKILTVVEERIKFSLAVLNTAATTSLSNWDRTRCLGQEPTLWLFFLLVLTL